MFVPVLDTEQPAPGFGGGFGAFTSEHGNLPVEALTVNAEIVGLAATVDFTVRFHNRLGVPVEATYICPLPDRAAVTAMRMRIGDRVVDGVLAERGHARNIFEAASANGPAALVEQERAGVFTIAAGQVAPGQRIDVQLLLHQPLAYSDGQVTFRFPLVVAPQYIPGNPLDGPAVGAGTAPDTDEVPDASRISPPVLLPGFPTPVRLAITATIAQEAFPIAEVGCTLPIRLVGQRGHGPIHAQLDPGQRLDRDFVLRLDTGDRPQPSITLVTVPEAGGTEGTFALTVLPPTTSDGTTVPRDVVVVLDCSADMAGWKISAARRAAARIVDTLTVVDRFTVLTFNDAVAQPPNLDPALVAATDRHRFHAIEHLAAVRARGGANVLGALQEAADLLGAKDRDSIVLLLSGAHVGNEDNVVTQLAPRMGRVRLHAIGVGAVVNAGLLQRLAEVGRGQFWHADSEDTLDVLTARLRRLIGPPLVTNLSLAGTGLDLMPGTVTPTRSPDLFAGTAVVIAGRWRGDPRGLLTLRGTAGDGRPWASQTQGNAINSRVPTVLWARGHLADLQAQYLTCPQHVVAQLEQHIIAISLRFNVLSTFTAFVAVDAAGAAPLGFDPFDIQPRTAGRRPVRILHPVERVADWAQAEAGLSPYAVEYARRSAPAGAAAQPVTPAQSILPPTTLEPLPAARASHQDPAVAGALPPPAPQARPGGHTPGWGAAPDQFGGTPGHWGAAPGYGGQYQPAPSPPRRRRRRDAVAAAAATVVVAGSAVLGAVLLNAGGNSSDIVVAPTTRVTTGAVPPPTGAPTGAPADPEETLSATDPQTGAELTITVTSTAVGSELSGAVAGLPVGETLRLVVVGTDGSVQVVTEWRVTAAGTSPGNLLAETTLAPEQIATIAVEDASGFRYVSVTR